MPGLLLGLLASSALAQTSAPLAIRGVTALDPAPRVGEPTDLRFELGGTYRNPSDPEQIRVEARIESPSGKSFLQPAYFGQAFEEGPGGPVAKGPGYWNLRLTATEPGAYRVTLSATDVSGTVIAPSVTLRASGGGGLGFVRVSERDRRYFETGEGAAFWPVGADLAQAGSLAGTEPGTWLPRVGDGGVNVIRVVLGPDSSPLALLRPTSSGSFGTLDLVAAWRLERLLAAARARGMRVQIVLASFASLREGAGGGWAASVWNRRNGGPLDYATDFWNAPTARRIWRAYMRYLVARFGADPAVFGWELWDDVDRTSGFSPERAREWHSAVAAELRGFDAAYRHPITTSVADPAGVKEVELLPELDFLQTHAGGDDPLAAVTVQGARKGGWGRPHQTRIAAPEGAAQAASVAFGDAMWAALTTGAAGASLGITSDGSNVDGANIGLSRFVKGIDFPREGFRSTRPQVGFLEPGTVTTGDLDVAALPRESSLNAQARTVVVGLESADRAAPLILAPRGSSPSVTFVTGFPRRTRFEVAVAATGVTPGRVAVSLDGQTVLTREIPAATEPRRYGLDVPPGRHRIAIVSSGDGGVEARFDVPGAIVRRRPGLDAWAFVGERTAIAWMRSEEGAIARLARGEREGVVPATFIRLDGLASGRYDVQIWDPRRGEIVSTIAREVPLSGVLTAPLPPFSHALAVKAVAR